MALNRQLPIRPAQLLPIVKELKYDMSDGDSPWIDMAMEKLDREGEYMENDFKAIVKLAEDDYRDNANSGSRITTWACEKEHTVIPPPPGTIESPFDPTLPMSANLPKLVETILANDITIIEAPTGTGKSIQMPCVIQHVVKTMANDPRQTKVPNNLNWKALHLVPTGEQVVQLHQILTEQYRKAKIDNYNIDTSIQFGLYSSAVDEKEELEKKDVKKNVNYVYSTTFFGSHIFSGSIFALIIDEVHELTPELNYLLWNVKQEFLKGEPPFVKVILVSATLKDGRRQELKNYFTDAGITVKGCQFFNKTYDVEVEQLGDDPSSGVVDVNRLDKCFNEEENDGVPNLKVLSVRGMKLLEHILNQRMQHGYVLPKDPGIISFHPGQNNLNKMRSDFASSAALKKYSQPKNRKIDIKKVCGKDRSDMEFLRTKYTQGQPARFVFSTALLATGVTVYGVSSVIDSGVIKVPGPYSRRGIFDLEIIWEDQAMRDQKKGRVGRLGNGRFYELFSPERSEQIGNNDLALHRLDRGYRTNHVPFFFDILPELLSEINRDTWIELLQECMTLGFLQTINDSGATFTRYAHNLAHGIFCLPLDQADFLIRCRGMGLTLYSLVWLASSNAEHAGLRRAQGGGIGRDDPRLPINRWAHLAKHSREERTTSDFETITEAVLNLMLCGPAKRIFDPSQSLRKPHFPPNVLSELQDADRINEIYRYVVIYTKALVNIRLLKKPKSIFHDLEQYYTFNHGNEGVSYYKLKKEFNVKFRANILASFGHHVAVRAPDRYEKPNRTLFMIPADPLDTANIGHAQLCQGEMAVTTTNEMAIYDKMIRRAATDQFLTGPMHFVDPDEFVLYGNVLGAERDEVDWKELTLKIQTSSAPAYFKFGNRETLEKVLNSRILFKYFPECMMFAEEEVRRDYTRLVSDMILNMDQYYNKRLGKPNENIRIDASNFVLARLHKRGIRFQGCSKPWPTNISNDSPVYGTTMAPGQYTPRRSNARGNAQSSDDSSSDESADESSNVQQPTAPSSSSRSSEAEDVSTSNNVEDVASGLSGISLTTAHPRRDSDEGGLIDYRGRTCECSTVPGVKREHCSDHNSENS